MERKRRGRQKISMEKMKNESNLQVTFSKRRAGLFKKASELCTLCGVDVAIIVFSPGQKVYSFGHPSVDAIVNKYINNITNTNPLIGNQALSVHHNSNPNRIQELNNELTCLQQMLEAETARAKHYKNMKKDNLHAQKWWEKDKNELSLQQLECLKAMLENLRSGVNRDQQKITLEAQNRATMGYQTIPMIPFDAQTNVFYAPFPNVASDGAGPSGTNLVSYDYHHPGYF